MVVLPFGVGIPAVCHLAHMILQVRYSKHPRLELCAPAPSARVSPSPGPTSSLAPLELQGSAPGVLSPACRRWQGSDLRTGHAAVSGPGQHCRSGNFPRMAPGAKEAAQGADGMITAHKRALGIFGRSESKEELLRVLLWGRAVSEGWRGGTALHPLRCVLLLRWHGEGSRERGRSPWQRDTSKVSWSE